MSFGKHKNKNAVEKAIERDEAEQPQPPEAALPVNADDHGVAPQLSEGSGTHGKRYEDHPKFAKFKGEK